MDDDDDDEDYDEDEGLSDGDDDELLDDGDDDEDEDIDAEGEMRSPAVPSCRLRNRAPVQMNRAAGGGMGRVAQRMVRRAVA